MDRKYDAIDWQSFSQKKNIEEIAKNTREKNDIQLTAAIEIAMGVSSIVSPSLFSGKLLNVVNWMVFIISIIPLVWLGSKYVIRLYERHLPGSDIPSVSAMVDLFDNEICYYALMADSYVKKLEDIDKEGLTAVDQFYYIEACFYINKTMYGLSLTSNCADKLYSTDSRQVYLDKTISYTRLKNIIDIIDNCVENVTETEKIIMSQDVENDYSTVFDLYKEEYERFKGMVYNMFEKGTLNRTMCF